MVEFALVAPLLIMLVFTVIHFGLALNLKQDLTRAAAEGARAGAVALPSQNQNQIAWNATDEAVDGFLNGGCDHADVSCTVDGPNEALCDYHGGNDPLDVERCINVTVAYTGGLAGNSVPFVGRVIPESLNSSSVVRVND